MPQIVERFYRAAVREHAQLCLIPDPIRQMALPESIAARYTVSNSVAYALGIWGQPSLIHY